MPIVDLALHQISLRVLVEDIPPQLRVVSTHNSHRLLIPLTAAGVLSLLLSRNRLISSGMAILVYGV